MRHQLSLVPIFSTLPCHYSSLLVTASGATPSTYPLLSVAVLQVIEEPVLPFEADAQQVHRLESVLGQDHKVGEESSQGLDHSCEGQSQDTGTWLKEGPQRADRGRGGGRVLAGLVCV